MNCCGGQQEDEGDEEQLPHVAARRSPALGNLQPLCWVVPCPPSTNGQEEKHLPPLLQPPICLIQHSIEQDAKRAGQEVEEGGRRDGKEGMEWRRRGRGTGREV